MPDAPSFVGFTGVTGATGLGPTGATGGFPGLTGPTGAFGGGFLFKLSGIASILAGVPVVDYFFDRGQVSGETVANSNVDPEGYPVASPTTLSALSVCADDPSQIPVGGDYVFQLVVFAGGGPVPVNIGGAAILYTSASPRVQQVTFPPFILAPGNTVGLAGSQGGVQPGADTSMLIMATVLAQG